MKKSSEYLVISTDVLPDVFVKTLAAKRYLAQGKASSFSEAAKQAGISRSAFYKYKDCVFAYEDSNVRRLCSFSMLLVDKPGVLSALLTTLSRMGANVVTVNQNMTQNDVAQVFLTVKLGENSSEEELSEAIRSVDGVVEIRAIK